MLCYAMLCYATLCQPLLSYNSPPWLPPPLPRFFRNDCLVLTEAFLGAVEESLKWSGLSSGVARCTWRFDFFSLAMSAKLKSSYH